MSLFNEQSDQFQWTVWKARERRILLKNHRQFIDRNPYTQRLNYPRDLYTGDLVKAIDHQLTAHLPSLNFSLYAVDSTTCSCNLQVEFACCYTPGDRAGTAFFWLWFGQCRPLCRMELSSIGSGRSEFAHSSRLPSTERLYLWFSQLRYRGSLCRHTKRRSLWSWKRVGRIEVCDD